jgi:molecular chaperone DnaK
MIADAERNQEEDRRLRELTDARNQLDSAAYQVERRLNELGPSAPAHEKARAEALISDARQAIKADAPLNQPLDQLRTLTSDLQQVYHGLAAAQPGAGPQAGPDDGSGRGGDDDVIDAEFTPHE